MATVNSAEQTCVEFGCGVGRVTIELARHYARVYAYDISATHLAHARRRADEARITNIVFHKCGDDPLAGLEPCDLYYSAIVFQHNPPVIISRLIRNALRSLKPSGIALFQVPTYELGYQIQDRRLAGRQSRAGHADALPAAGQRSSRLLLRNTAPSLKCARTTGRVRRLKGYQTRSSSGSPTAALDSRAAPASVTPSPAPTR